MSPAGRGALNGHPAQAELGDSSIVASDAPSTVDAGRLPAIWSKTMAARPVPDGWPELDPGAFFGLTGELTKALSDESEADPAAVLATVVTVVSGLVGPRPHCFVTGPHPARLYTLVVGPTGEGRKGTSWGLVTRALQQASPDWDAPSYTMSGHASGEALIASLSLSQKADGGHVLYEPEFARVLATAGREGCNLTQVLRELWDSGAASVVARTNPVSVSDAHLAAVAHVTPEELRARLRPTEVAGGTANRFLFIASHRRQLVASLGKLSSMQLGSLAKDLSRAVTEAQGRGEVEFSQGAWEFYSAHYGEMERRELRPELADYLVRWAPQTARIALVYALLDRSPCITEDHLRAAHALWAYSEATVTYMFGGDLGDSDAEKLLKAVREAGEAGLDGAAQHKVFSGHSAGRLQPAIDALVRKDLIVVVRRKTGGRPAMLLLLRCFVDEAGGGDG